MTALVLRHGATLDNDQNKVRSWLDVPLDQNGIREAHEAAKFLEKYPIRHVMCSPLLRAFVTADIAAAPHRLQVYQHRGMFPWNLGIFGGMPKDATKDAVKLFVSNRDVEVPNGESLEAFEARVFAFFAAALKVARKSGLTLYVCHNSVVTALAHMMDGPEAKHLEDTVEPGGVAEIYYDGAKHILKPVFGVVEESRYGPS